MALKDAMSKGKRPPHLRRGTARARCGNCTHFRSNYRHGLCELYRWPVQASQMCDSWRKET